MCHRKTFSFANGRITLTVETCPKTTSFLYLSFCLFFIFFFFLFFFTNEPKLASYLLGKYSIRYLSKIIVGKCLRAFSSLSLDANSTIINKSCHELEPIHEVNGVLIANAIRPLVSNIVLFDRRIGGEDRREEEEGRRREKGNGRGG